jgi:predicted  nucleic acid-binding Zn-ribbon protein
MSLSFHLYQLQKVDTQLDQTRHRLEDIRRLIDEDQTVQIARQALAEAEAEQKTAHLALKRVEDAVGSKRIKKDQSESSLYGGKIKNPKELQDLQAEVASLKKGIGQLEDQQLEAMLALESADARVHAAQELLRKVEAEAGQQHASLHGEQSQLLKNQEKLTAERQLLASQIPSDQITTYDRLRKSKRGVAVATVDDDSCGSCGSSLTPAERQAARSPAQLVTCPSCSRILYAG